MNLPIQVTVECAKGEVMNAIETIRQKHGLPACIIDGVVSSVLAEIRSEEKIELINATNAMMKEKNAEIEALKTEKSERRSDTCET